jgi:S1-C subfamily serine protease
MGDIIIEVAGSKIRGSSDLVRILDKYEVGDEVDIIIIRENVKNLYR